MNWSANEDSEGEDDDTLFNLSAVCEAESSLRLMATLLRSNYAGRRREDLPQLVALTVLLGGLAVFGALGNGFTLYIYGRKMQRTTSNLLIFTLGGIDLLINLLVIPANLIDSWKLELYSDVACRLQELLKSAAIFASTLIIVIIAVDRALILCFVPAIRIRMKHLKFLIVAALVFSLMCAAPAALAVSKYIKICDGQFVDIGLRLCLPNDQFVSSENIHLFWQIVAIIYLTVVAVLVGCYVSILTCICLKRSQVCRSFNAMNATVHRDVELCVRKPSAHDSPNNEHSRLNSAKCVDYEANENISMIELNLPIFDGIISEEMRAAHQKRCQAQSDCGGGGGSDSGLQSASASNSCSAIVARHVVSDQLTPLRCYASRSLLTTRPSAESASSLLVRPIRKISIMTNHSVERDACAGSEAKGELQRRRKKSSHASFGSRSRIGHLKTLKVLAIISASFVLSYTPMMIANLGVPSFAEGYTSGKRGARLLVLYYLYHLQSAINPV